MTVFAVTNAVYMLLVVVAVSLCAYRSAVVPGLALVVVFFSNALFHIGFSAISGIYSPGTITAVVLYLPLTFSAFWCAFRERMLTRRRVIAAILLGAIVGNAPLRLMQRWV